MRILKSMTKNVPSKSARTTGSSVFRYGDSRTMGVGNVDLSCLYRSPSPHPPAECRGLKGCMLYCYCILFLEINLSNYFGDKLLSSRLFLT